MKMVRKTVAAIIIILLLWVLRLILDSASPASYIFHRRFLFSLQVLVIVWLLISFVLYLFKVGNSWFARSLPIILVMAVLGADILFSYWMEKPSKIPSFLKTSYKNYYGFFERKIIEYEPCSVYDTAYGYKLYPGLSFSFGNIEYKNQYAVNSESLRDDESSMMGPLVICAGNSYTLGVGIDQNKTYSDLLEGITNKPVLNVGYSDFGTVRELKRVASSDTSILEYLVIQYSKYDVYENAAFIQNNGVFRVNSDSAYKMSAATYRWRREYFPGKYAITISLNFIKSKLKSIFRRNMYFLSRDEAISAKYFLQVIDMFKPGGNARMLVTEINDYNDLNSGFLPAIDSLLKTPQFSHLQPRVQTVDVSDILQRSDYYIIDSHLRPSGHEKIARRIAQHIK
jgi:hypothetical protein